MKWQACPGSLRTAIVVPPTRSPRLRLRTLSSCAGTIFCGIGALRTGLDLPSNHAMERAMIEHIQTLAGRYRGKVHSWDVVNEPIEPQDGRSDRLRAAVFLNKMGPDYLD